MSQPFEIEENARRIGNYRWAETRLFETLGGWVDTVPELDVKTMLGIHCHKHAWHAELWHERLPALHEMPADRLTAPANEAMVRLVEALTEPDSPHQTIEKLTGVYRLLIPRLIAAYTHHQTVTKELTDGPTSRALKLILQDELEDWRKGEVMLQLLIATPGDAARAATHLQRLESIMVEAGGITGPGAIAPS